MNKLEVTTIESLECIIFLIGKNFSNYIIGLNYSLVSTRVSTLCSVLTTLMEGLEVDYGERAAAPRSL